jgi:hypothetical protein
MRSIANSTIGQPYWYDGTAMGIHRTTYHFHELTIYYGYQGGHQNVFKVKHF